MSATSATSPPWNPNALAVIVALPMETQGLFEALEIPVYYCGIGKVNAAHKATEVILKTQCQRLLNLGTAGSHRLPTHTLVECSGFLQRDMDLSPLGFPLGETPMDDVKGLIIPSQTYTSWTQGICGTGDRFESAPPRLACDLVDMEAYAIAKVCKKMKVEFSAFKYITDGSDDQAHKDWFENLKPASKKLLEVYQQLTET